MSAKKGDIYYDVRANTTHAEKDLSSFEGKVNASGGKFGGLKEIATGALRAIGTEFVALGQKAIGFSKDIVNTGASFEAEMSKVKAISGVTEDEFKGLTDLAKKMGATTKFTATEAGQGLEYMAMAGWKAQEMTDGLPAILNLAAAAGEDLGVTSDIVTDALTAFGLTAGDASMFADVLAAASSNANTNVSMMGETFKYAAPVAGSLGYSIKDTAVAIGLMANAGIKGSQAGTALRGMFTRLAKPTKEVYNAMDALGISITDADKNVKPLNVLLEEMRSAFDGLSQAQKAQYAAMIAGQEGMSGLLAIVDASDKDFEDLTKAVAESDGTAAKMAETMQDNLQGSFVRLSSAVDGFKLALFEGFEGPLKGLAEDAIVWVGDLTKGFEENGISGMVDAAGNIVGGFIEKLFEQIPTVIETGAQMVTSLGEGLVSKIPEFLANALPMVADFTANLRANFGKFVDAGIGFVMNAIKGIVAALPDLLNYVPEIISNLAGLINDNVPKLLKAAFEAIISLAKGIWEHRGDIVNNIGKILQAIWDVITAINWLELGGKIITGLLSGIKSLAGGIVEAFKGLIRSIWNTMTGGGEWWQIGENIISGIVNGIKAAPGKLIEAVKGIAKSALGAVKKFFGINSPSRVMADEVGVMLPRGIALGIDRDTDKAVESVDRMSEEIFSAATVGVDYDIPDLSGYAQDLGANLSYQSAAEINVPLYLDGREIARGTAYYMGSQMAWEAQ